MNIAPSTMSFYYVLRGDKFYILYPKMTDFYVNLMKEKQIKLAVHACSGEDDSSIYKIVQIYFIATSTIT